MRFAGALVAGTTLVVAACGGGEPRELAGYRREPAPVVGQFALPDLSADRSDPSDFPLRAETGELLVVYFGYTNCPDFCPTTLSDLRLATRRMNEADTADIDVAVITVDPDRDVPVLAEYVTSFFEHGHALGTEDAGLLARIAAPFGAQYNVHQTDDGEIEVAHTTQLYAIDDSGELVLTWQFGVTIDDLAADLEHLLEATRS